MREKASDIVARKLERLIEEFERASAAEEIK